MIQGYGPVMQAFLGTLFTWALTAAGASLVLVIRGDQRKVLDASLGFAAGVMTAASFWSLLDPAIEMAENSKLYGENGEYAFAPVALGFLLGSLFVYGADKLITVLGVHSPNMMLALHATSHRKDSKRDSSRRDSSHMPLPDSTAIDGFSDGNHVHHRKRVGKNVKKSKMNTEARIPKQSYDEAGSNIEEIQHGQWKRIILLVVAITVHNIPEGLAVGVGFGAIGTSESASFDSARAQAHMHLFLFTLTFMGAWFFITDNIFLSEKNRGTASIQYYVGSQADSLNPSEEGLSEGFKLRTGWNPGPSEWRSLLFITLMPAWYETIGFVNPKDDPSFWQTF